MSAIQILEELRDSLPPNHQERPGVVRSIEVLRHDSEGIELVVSEREFVLLLEGLSANISEYEVSDEDMKETHVLMARLEKMKDGESS